MINSISSSKNERIDTKDESPLLIVLGVRVERRTTVTLHKMRCSSAIGHKEVLQYAPRHWYDASGKRSDVQLCKLTAC
jgi:hypothetical protein